MSFGASCNTEFKTLNVRFDSTGFTTVLELLLLVEGWAAGDGGGGRRQDLPGARYGDFGSHCQVTDFKPII